MNMRSNTSMFLPLLMAVSVINTLACHATQLQNINIDSIDTKRSHHQLDVCSKKRKRIHARHTGAFIPSILRPTRPYSAHTIEVLPLEMSRAPPFFGMSSPRYTPHHNILNSLASSSNNDDNNNIDIEPPNEEHQKGLEEAFASLEALTSEDLVEETDNQYSSTLKYSKTDDTPAYNSGKSTKEEVEHYLDMQQEMEGTAIVQDEVDQNADDDPLVDDEGANTAIEDSEDEFPWTSINPILRLRGPVATGYGRGGKKLGIPTANLPSSLFQSALEDVDNGVYFGWAVIEQRTGDISSNGGRNVPIKAVVNVGYSPTFEGKENKEKIVEAHIITKSSPMEKLESTGEEGESNSNDNDLIDEIDGDFYDETLRLQLIGYLRPEQKFDSFPELIAQIHRDIGNANSALDSMPFIFSKEDEFVKNGVDWVGTGGGDYSASWEFESW